MYFNSDNISVFPTRNRLDSVDRMARFMHESNIASVGQALTQKSAFVVSGLTLDGTVLKNGTVWIAGRLFSTGDVNITSLINGGKTYIYMSIKIGGEGSLYENEVEGTDKEIEGTDEDRFYDGLELDTANSLAIQGKVVLPLFKKDGDDWVKMAEYRYPHDINGVYGKNGLSLSKLLDEYFEFGESISIKKPLKTGKVEIDDDTEADDTDADDIDGALVVKGGVSVAKKIITQSTEDDSIATKGGVSAAGKVKGKTIEGDIKDTTTTFTVASTQTNINSGEKTSTIFGKIKKWFTDLKALAFKDTIGTNDIYDGAVTGAKIQSSSSVDSNRAIGTNHIQNSAVTNDKISSVAGIKVTGTVAYATNATNANITKTADTTNGDKLQIGSGTSVNVTNATNANYATTAKNYDTSSGGIFNKFNSIQTFLTLSSGSGKNFTCLSRNAQTGGAPVYSTGVVINGGVTEATNGSGEVEHNMGTSHFTSANYVVIANPIGGGRYSYGWRVDIIDKNKFKIVYGNSTSGIAFQFIAMGWV